MPCIGHRRLAVSSKIEQTDLLMLPISGWAQVASTCRACTTGNAAAACAGSLLGRGCLSRHLCGAGNVQLLGMGALTVRRSYQPAGETSPLLALFLRKKLSAINCHTKLPRVWH